MSITPFLSSRSFDQKTIDMMSTAFVAECIRLGLADRSDPATLIVAKKGDRARTRRRERF